MSPEEMADRFAAEAEDRARYAADELEAAHEARRAPAPPPDHSGYRFTAEDEARIRAAVAEFASGLPASHGSQAKLVHAEQAARVGASSIGCGLHDLREVEVAWIYTEARRALVGIPALEAAVERARGRVAEGLGGAEIELAGYRGRLRAARILLGEIDGSDAR